MNAAPDFGPTIRQNSSPKHHDFPHQNGPTNHALEYGSYMGGGGGGGTGGGMQTQQQQHQQQQQQQDLTIDGIPNNFSHRRSRASRTFKNPPQPHMCIKERTIDGKEVFINVLSWTRIANPDNPDAPIPLYGGMKVGKIPPGSPKVPPLVYAVMASPEVLKKAGRKCPDTPERMNLVDLMCEFVEAMNPSLHLSRKPEILKDRDLSGELKDVWSAVQACRDKGRSDNGPPENLVVYTEFGPDSAPSYEHTIQQHQQQQQQQLQYQQQHDQLPNTYEQQGRFPLSGVSAQQQNYPYHHHQQQQQQQQQQQHQQSAINNHNNHNSSVHTSIEQISAIPDSGSDDGSSNGALTPTNNAVNGGSPTTTTTQDELLAKETESLKLSSSSNGGKLNGLTLPNADGSANTPTVTSTTASSPTVPQTSPTTTNAAPSTPAPPVKEPTKSSSGHNFFPMFRSSKSSSSSNSISNASASTNGGASSATNQSQHAGLSAGSDRPSVNGDPAASGSPAPSTESSATPEPSTTKSSKTGSKKSGLNFFRRNKSVSSTDGKKEPSTPTKQPPQQPQPGTAVLPAGISSAAAATPATPAATGAASTGPESKLLAATTLGSADENALAMNHHRTGTHHHPAFHLDGNSNGTAGSNGSSATAGSAGGSEIVESNAATIAAK